MNEINENTFSISSLCFSLQYLILSHFSFYLSSVISYNFSFYLPSDFSISFNLGGASTVEQYLDSPFFPTLISPCAFFFSLTKH